MIPLNAPHPLQNGHSPSTMASFTTDHFSATNSSWNSNQEIARLLYSAPSHPEWITQQVAIRPQTGAQYMFCRFDGNWFKMDGYEWKKRREGKLIREDHMKLKVNKQEILSANYAHSSVVPTFHRRVYWLTNNPDYALVHYLNTETEINLKNIMDKILACIKLNSLNLGQQQLLDQISPIYANMLNQQDIACICEKLGNIVRYSPCGNNETHEGKPQMGAHTAVATPRSQPISNHGSSHQLERRNSCSSAFRPGLSSLILRRQPSTFSDSVDVNYGAAPALNNMMDGMAVKEPLTGYSVDGRSHSGETQRSSNQDEDMSISLQPSQPASHSSHIQDNQPSTSLAPITDITPNSGCVKGGTKVLVIGGWYMKGHDYTVMFGERRIPARLIQVGVLSVIVPPASMSGIVPVRVLCNGQVISSSSEFTYKEEQDELTVSALRQCMVDRLQIVVHAFGAMDKLEWVASIDEDSVLSLLRSLTGRRPSMPSLLSAHPTLPSRTILHIAAALDYHKVIEHVLAWRRNLPFSREFDPLARDGEGRTPLHMAVAAGHVASARVLVRACRTTVDVLDDRGRTPCDLSCDEQMMRLTARTSDRDADEHRALPKNAEDVEHVTSTALWVLTNGETVTDEHLLRDRHPAEGEDSCSSILSDAPNDDHHLGRPGTSGSKWCDEPLHVEISMDTDVHVPDS
ncbi:CG-1 domain protein, partial [Cooperia oncophora]